MSEDRFLWRGICCSECFQPIRDEKNAFTIFENGHYAGALCQECGEKSEIPEDTPL